MDPLSKKAPILFVGAPPGCGKTSVMRAMLDSMTLVEQIEVAFDADDQFKDPKFAKLRQLQETMRRKWYKNLPKPSTATVTEVVNKLEEWIKKKLDSGVLPEE